MLASAPRRFTLFDAMVLIAAIAVALFPIRFFLADWSSSLGRPPDWRLLLVLGAMGDGTLCPLALTLSPALLALRLRRPRPGLARVFRQPGTAACTAVVVYELSFSVITLLSLFLHFFLSQRHLFLNTDAILWLWAIPMCFIGVAVAAVWAVLWMTGAWRAEPSWIDRAGRILGTYWMANSFLLGPVILAELG
jgi:hypothetical protein